MKFNIIAESVREVLLEAKYDSMMQLNEWSTLFNNREKTFTKNKNILNSFLKWAKNTLKREDRIIWYMRIKIFLIMSESAMYIREISDEDRLKEFDRNFLKIISKFKKKSSIRTVEYVDGNVKTPPSMMKYDFLETNPNNLSSTSIETRLGHLISLTNVYKIQNYTFTKETPSSLISTLEEMEEEWKINIKRYVPVSESDDPFISLGNNFYWVDINKASCTNEGNAMGHCGNANFSPNDPNMTIFSLREKIKLNKESWWKPHATFIYHKNRKSLGEMKGVNNNKPNTKYNKYILQLLLDDRIEQIDGGGFLPENNFSLDDLDQKDRDMLLKKKPNLIPFIQRIRNMSDDELIDYIKTTSPELYSDTDKAIILNSFKDLESFSYDYGSKELDNVIESLNDGDYDVGVYKYNDFDSEEFSYYIPTDILNIINEKMQLFNKRNGTKYDSEFNFIMKEHGDILAAMQDVYFSLMGDEFYHHLLSNIESSLDDFGEDILFLDYDIPIDIHNNIDVLSHISTFRKTINKDDFEFFPKDLNELIIDFMEYLTDYYSFLIDYKSNDYFDPYISSDRFMDLLKYEHNIDFKKM